MSSSETSPPASFNQFALPALVAGLLGATNLPAYFLPGVSKIVGCVRTTAGGTVGQPRCIIAFNAGAVGNFATVAVASTSNLDTSVYTLLWVNEIAGSSVANPLNPSGFPAITVLGC
jgi:uncharacterized membrane protein AbrB (regulator of aidB expression)